MATDFSALEYDLPEPAEYLRLEREAATERFMLNTRYNILLAQLNAAAQAEEAYRLLAEIADRG